MEAADASESSLEPGAPPGDAPEGSGVEGTVALGPEQALRADAGSAPRRSRDGGWVSSTYLAESLPYAIAHKVAAEFFTAAGASLQIIGLVSLFGLPWNLKFLWSPLVDLYWGARAWIVAAEIALVVAVLGLAWAADSGALGVMAGGFAVLAAVAATHDIAVDGFYLRALDRKAQAALSGLRVAAYRVALSLSALLIVLAGKASWRASFTTAGLVLAALACLHALGLPRLQETKDTQRRYREAFASFLRQPRIGLCLAFIGSYRAGDALMFAMSSPLLRSLGWDLEARGWLGGVGTVVSIGGSIAGGMLIARRGFARTIFPIAALQGVAILLYVALAWLRPAAPWVVAFIALEQLAAGVGTAVLAVFLMRRCAEPYKAAHFAIGSALMSVPATVVGSISGYLADWLGFTAFFALAFVASIPGVVLSRRVPTD